jgi:hypothetical protein
MKGGRGQLKSLRSFLRTSLRSSAYSRTIRRASSVRESLLGGSGLDPFVIGGITEWSCQVRLTLAHRQDRGPPFFVVDLDQGIFGVIPDLDAPKREIRFAPIGGHRQFDAARPKSSRKVKPV